MITVLNSMFCLGQTTAQTQSNVLSKGQIYGSITLSPGWTKMKNYSPSNFYASTLYLQPGKSINLSFSLGGEKFGCTLDYINDRYSIDVTKTIMENLGMVELEINGIGSSRLQIEGFLIGPYFGDIWIKRRNFDCTLCLPLEWLPLSRQEPQRNMIAADLASCQEKLKIDWHIL